MKLRLKNNSIRLRLTQNETERFAATGRVEETIDFSVEKNEKFVYALEASAGANEISAKFENHRITVFVPKNQADEWTKTAQISMENASAIGGNKTLRLLIEKDFACLKPRAGEDDTDAFPNPLEGVAC